MSAGISDVVASVRDQFPCRESQILQLACLLSPNVPRPSNVVVHGLQATGKSAIVKEVISCSKAKAVILTCQECITVRHLLERTIAECVDVAAASTGEALDRRPFARCENVSSLHADLQRLVALTGPLVIVFDGMDRMRESSSNLFPALARVANLVTSLTFVYILSLPSPRLFRYAGLPHIHFPAYERPEALHILSRQPIPVFSDILTQPSPSDPKKLDEDTAFLWTRFCAAVWDSLAQSAARDLSSFRSLASKIWPLFTMPVREGRLSLRDFSKLMVANRALLQSDECLVDHHHESDRDKDKEQHQLPPVAKYILCAAYLASYNPARKDQIYFMEWTEKKRKRKGGGGRRGRPPKHRKIPRKALPPSPFTLVRLQAILSAIYPVSITQSESGDIAATIATLTSARLLLRAGAAGVGGDPLDERARWKVNVGWDYVVKLGRSVGFEMHEWSDE